MLDTRTSASPPEDTVPESLFRRLVDEQVELISLARPGGELIYVNASCARHHGRPVAQLIGTHLYDWVLPADRDAVRRQIEHVLATGEVAQGGNRLVTADGSERWFAWTNTRRRDDAGKSCWRGRMRCSIAPSGTGAARTRWKGSSVHHAVLCLSGIRLDCYLTHQALGQWRGFAETLWQVRSALSARSWTARLQTEHRSGVSPQG